MTIDATVEQQIQEQPVNGIYPSQDVLASQVEQTDSYRYGYRIARETQPDGTVLHPYAPLTQADFLDPQVGDHLVQSDYHLILVVSLFTRFRKRYLQHSSVGVFSDLKMLWRMSDVKEPAPDLAVVPHLKNKGKRRSSFDVLKEGTRPCLVIEVISPDYPGDDTTKVDIYERVGIQEYMIIDPHTDDETADFELKGYRLVAGNYQPIKPDAQGRLLSETTGIWFGLDETKHAISLTDAATGDRLLTDEEEYEARLAAEAEVARLKTLLEKRNGQ